MFSRAVVSSPATIANFGPGFDSFGLCLASPIDRVSIRKLDAGRVEVRVIGKHKLPTDPERNTASYAAMRLAELAGKERTGFSIAIKKGMKPGSGIGSSAASSAGGALAMAALLGVKDRRIILEAAAMGEELVAGTRHFDNVSAAIYGGFTILSDLRTRTIIHVRPPPFKIVVVVPRISIETRKAREILPKNVPLTDAVRNVGWASGMLHAMMRKDVPAIGRYLDDTLAAPYRSRLIPGYRAVRDAALRSGAVGVSIGGSGPAVFAITLTNEGRVRQAMVRAFKSEAGLTSESFVTVPGRGAKIEELS